MAHASMHFGGDVHALDGVWAPSTSAANFCEEDYAVTVYIAEFVNALSNLAYIYYALSSPHRPNSLKSCILGTKLDYLSLSLCLVGSTSLLFHATLRQTLQFSDDLSMFALAGSLLHALYSANQSASTRKLVTWTTVAGIGALSGVYLHSGNLLIHTGGFALMLMVVWPRTLYLIYYVRRSAADKARLTRRFLQAVGVLLAAFAVWNMDLAYCDWLRQARQDMRDLAGGGAGGVVMGWVLEGHAWWHLGTAIGAGWYIEVVREVCDM